MNPIPFCVFIALMTPMWSAADVVSDLSKAEDHISGRVKSLSNRIDRFFSREDTVVEESRTRLKISFDSRFAEYQEPSYNFAVGAKLVLPRTKEKLHLLLFSDEEGVFSRHEAVRATPDPSLDESVEDQKFRFGLRHLLHSSRTSGLALDSGIKLKDPLDPFIRITGRRSIFLKEFELRFFDKLFWFESEGWATSAAVDLDRPLDDRWLFRFSNNGDLDHETGLWKFNHFFGLYHQQSERTAWAYYVGFQSNDEPVLAVHRYYLSLNYRYSLIPNWLFVQVTPEVFWPREEDWQRLTGILFKLETIFGN